MQRIVLAFSFILLSFNLFGQSQPTCNPTASPTVVHAEGLAERLGDLAVSCSGGPANTPATINLFISVNANITNRIDANGVPQGITITGAATATGAQLSGNGLYFVTLNYQIPATPATAVVTTFSGIRAAVAPLATGTGPTLVNYTLVATGAQVAGGAVQAAVALPTLLASYISNGVPCSGSFVPSTPDFNSFASISNSSTIRVTEASNAAFTKQDAGADSGLRLIVSLTGYGPGVRLFVPDAVAGNSATAATSAGAFATTVNSGSYTPGANQLLLVRVNGADPKGVGGTLAIAAPGAATTLTSVSEITVVNGAGYVVYEVVDSNPALQESAQIPVFLTVPAFTCPGTQAPVLSVQIAPLSIVSTATQVDPIPRFTPVTPMTDCTLIGDCRASYFPALTVDTTPLTITGNSKGGAQNAFIRVGNPGSGVVTFTTSVTYPSGAPAGWLSVSPATGSNNVTVNVVANPANLDPGTYTASVNINAGAFGSASVPVTFNVGAAGVTVQSVGNAASFVFGTVTPGSYAVIFGLNLAGTNVGVTFNGLPATIVYKDGGQINVIVPAALGAQQAAAVVVTADGKVSDPFRVNLAANALGIFTPGIVNIDDSKINSASSPAARGSFVSVYFTGLTLPVTPGQVTVNIGAQLNLLPTFAGAQPTYPALDQVNILIPAGLTLLPNPVKLSICTPNAQGQQACSNAVDLYLK